jgi:uncharacterized coiled-coil protein SlyX
MSKSCSKCKKNVTAIKFPGLSCVHCNKFFHVKCAGLCDSSFRVLQDDKLSWTCQSCKRRSSIIVPSSLSPGVKSPSHLQVPTTPRLGGPSTSAASPKSPTTSVNSQPSKLTQLEQKLAQQSVQISELTELLRATQNRVEALESQLASKSNSVDSLSTKLADLQFKTDQTERQLTGDKLEIQGLPTSALERPLEAITSIGESINCPISCEDLVVEPVQLSSRLSLVFKSRVLRRKFLLAGKAFNKANQRFVWNRKAHKIHVNEELSDCQKKLYRETKNFASSHQCKFVWIGVSGKIFLKKSENFAPIVVDSLSTLRDEYILSKLSGSADENPEGPSSDCL